MERSGPENPQLFLMIRYGILALFELCCVAYTNREMDGTEVFGISSGQLFLICSLQIQS